ncbi:MAG: methyltransferase domain-containing protein [Anaerolineae bacterium]
MTHDRYEDMAGRYDLTFGSVDQHDPTMARFFQRVFAEHEVQSVLDCACGTGRHLLLFHSLGLEVVGSDVSEAMLVQARKNLAGHGVEVPLHQADYRNLPQTFGRRFDAVVCLAAIGYMPDETQVLRAFRSMRSVLRDRGVLILTAVPTDRQWAEQSRFILNANTRDFSRIFAIDYLERTARYNVLDIHHGEERRGLEVWSIELTVLLQADQQRLLEQAGFRSVEFFGSFVFDPYDRTASNRLIAVAQR